MKKTLLIILTMIGLMVTLQATINTNPENARVNVGDTISFILSCENFTTCNWYWGDGRSLLGVADSAKIWRDHIYKNPGKYSVYMHRLGSPTGYYCNMDEYKAVTILENRSITASTTQPYAAQPVTFTAVNFRTPTNTTWNMGDGKVYTGQGTKVVHAFARAGTYLVRAFDWNGDTMNTPVSLSITVAMPIRSITFSPALPRVDQEVAMQGVNFRSESIDWNFGDGTPQQTYSAAVSHRYQNPGTFTISAREHGMDLGPVTRPITILPENRSLVLSDSEAMKGEPVTVTALNFRGPLVLWDFGDGSTASGPGAVASFGRLADVSGPAIMTHTYSLPGSYIITARDENGASEKKFQATITILGINDQVNLEIAEITLDNGKYYEVIPKKSKNIRAQLRMKMRGTGIVSGYWIVDNQPYEFFNEVVYQGQIRTIFTREIPGLPVFDPGMHTVTVQLTRPQGQAVVFPTLRYFVLPYDNVIETLSPWDGAVIKEDEVANFSWQRVLGGSYYQISFANSLFPLLRDDASLKWLDCPDGLSFSPDVTVWNAIKRNQWTYWKVRASDSGKNIVAESAVQEMKVIIPGAEIGIQKITDLDGKGITLGSDFTTTQTDQLIVHGYLTYPGEAEYLILRVYSNDNLVDQLLFRDVKKDEKKMFETSVPNMEKESRVIFEVLKSSSPSMIIGYAELKLKKE
jgi:PKD repeat protein